MFGIQTIKNLFFRPPAPVDAGPFYKLDFPVRLEMDPAAPYIDYEHLPLPTVFIGEEGGRIPSNLGNTIALTFGQISEETGRAWLPTTMMTESSSRGLAGDWSGQIKKFGSVVVPEGVPTRVFLPEGLEPNAVLQPDQLVFVVTHTSPRIGPT